MRFIRGSKRVQHLALFAVENYNAAEQYYPTELAEADR